MSKHAIAQEPRHGRQRMVAAPDPFRVVGGIILLFQGSTHGTAAVDRGPVPGRHCGGGPLFLPHGNRARYSIVVGCMGGLPWRRTSQQPHPVQLAYLGPDRDCQWSCRDPQCNDTRIRDHRRPFPNGRRTFDTGQGCRNPPWSGRRRGTNRRRRPVGSGSVHRGDGCLSRRNPVLRVRRRIRPPLQVDGN